MNKIELKNKVNPEILREKTEAMRSAHMYDGNGNDGYPYTDNDYSFGSMLYPDYFRSNAASSTEATGLMQNIPIDNAELESYYALYNYCLDRPIAEEEVTEK